MGYHPPQTPEYAFLQNATLLRNAMLPCKKEKRREEKRKNFC
jgi:hypothetical protein